MTHPDDMRDPDPNEDRLAWTIIAIALVAVFTLWRCNG